MFLERANAYRKVFRESKWAFVESGTARYGMARMASILSDPAVMELRAFRDVDEAREWLGVKTEEGSQ